MTLANTVAEAVTEKYPDKLIGMYAYSQHSPPPNLKVHPSVVISVATSFITGGFTVDQLMDGWSKKAAILGIREYYSVNTWDRDLPSGARGGDLDYLRTTIPHFFEQNARFLSAESSDNWGPNGLGYFLAARMLWDVRETKKTGADWKSPEGNNPWKSSASFTRDEIDTLVRNGIAHRKLLDFAPVAFSSDLVRPTALKLSEVKTGSMGGYSRQPRTYYTWADQTPQTFPFTVKGGVIYANRGVTRLDLYPLLEPEGKSVAHVEVEPDRNDHDIELTTSLIGLHRVEIVAGGGASAAWPENTPMAIESSAEHPARLCTRWTLYFYVPRGTTSVGGFGEGVGTLRDSIGKTLHTFEGKPGYFNVPVPAGQDGKLWSFHNCAGDKTLMTVPPYLARNSAELLLPREVVQKDSKP